MRMLRILVLLAATLLPVFAAHAVVTTVAQYRLGENDPGAANGAPGANPTVAAVGGVNLPRFGNPVYSNSVPDVASSLSMLFNGTDARYVAGSVLTTASDNFGIEAWVRSTGSTTGNALIAYNGNTSTSGWGIFRLGGTYTFLYGGVTVPAGAPVTTNWTHLALVRASGTTSFYVNGVVAVTDSAAPNPPAGQFAIGGNPLSATELFAGNIDEVRLFTFAPGQFLVSDLNLARAVSPAIPVPAAQGTWLGLLFAALFAVAWLRLRRRAM